MPNMPGWKAILASLEREDRSQKTAIAPNQKMFKNGDCQTEISNRSHPLRHNIKPGDKVKVTANNTGAVRHKNGRPIFTTIQPGEVFTVAEVTDEGFPRPQVWVEVAPGVSQPLFLEDVAPVSAHVDQAPRTLDKVELGVMTMVDAVSTGLKKLSPVMFLCSLFDNGRLPVMLKKSAIILAVVALLGTAAFGTSFKSYLTTGLDKTRSAVKAEIPLEFEIDRAKKLVSDLKPDLKAGLAAVSREKVQIERLSERIAASEQSLQSQRDEILTLKSDLETAATSNVSFTYGQKDYSREEVERDLAARFERFRINEENLKGYRALLVMQQKNLAAAQEQLSTLMSQKSELEVKIEGLRSKLQMVNVAKTASEYNFDSSHLGEAKALVEEISQRLDAEEKLVNADGELLNEIDLSKQAPGIQPRTERITDRVEAYFAPKPDTAKVAADKGA